METFSIIKGKLEHVEEQVKNFSEKLDAILGSKQAEGQSSKHLVPLSERYILFLIICELKSFESGVQESGEVFEK